MDIDTHIETPDDDDEPRPPACRECGGSDGDHDVTCSFHADYYEPPVPEYNAEDDCGND